MRDVSVAIADEAESGWSGVGRIQVIVGAKGKPYLADSSQRRLHKAALEEVARLWNSATNRNLRLAPSCVRCGSTECSGAFGFVCDR